MLREIFDNQNTVVAHRNAPATTEVWGRKKVIMKKRSWMDERLTKMNMATKRFAAGFAEASARSDYVESKISIPKGSSGFAMFCWRERKDEIDDRKRAELAARVIRRFARRKDCDTADIQVKDIGKYWTVAIAIDACHSWLRPDEFRELVLDLLSIADGTIFSHMDNLKGTGDDDPKTKLISVE